ncbi:hypothetical protein C8F01DRAFT_1252803 [Mycena amicta]|nr:hypothetical protein C8F01DRAFT_1252803 [Mycena amicta]
MHRCLQIPEITAHIVSHVPNLADGPRNSTLGRLAQTCRHFLEPALDELWRSPGQNTLFYVLRCLPTDLLAVTDALEPHGLVTVRLLRPFILSDWDRPQIYCQRVRMYSHAGNALARHRNILAMLSVWMPTEFLFPRLRHLTWQHFPRNDELEGANLLRFLVSPYLQEIFLYGHAYLCLSVLPMIARKGLLLTNVRIFTAHGVGELAHLDQNSISHFVRSLSRIKSLRVPALNGAAWLHLCSLPGLTKLEVGDMTDTSLAIIPPRDTASFPSLLVFCVDAVNVTVLTRLLPMFAAAPLAEIRFPPPESTTTAEITALFSALAVHCSATTMKTVYMSCSTAFPPEDNAWMLERSAFLRLRAFKNLTWIELCALGGFDFGDEALGALVQECPLLITLNLSQPNIPSAFTLSVLIPIARHCKELKSLDLALDTSTVPPAYPTTESGERISQSRLSTFHVGYSRLDHPFPVAQFLSSVFPELEEINCGWIPRDEDQEEEEEEQDEDAAEGAALHSRWVQVEELIPRLAAIRKEEQLWTAQAIERGVFRG